MKHINKLHEQNAEFIVVKEGVIHNRHCRLNVQNIEFYWRPLSCRKEDIFLMISETEPRADELMCDRGPVIMLSRGDAAVIGGCDSSTPCFRNLSPPSCLAVICKLSER